MQSLAQKLLRTILLMIVLLAAASVSAAAATLKDYAARLEQAAQRIEQLLVGEGSDTEIARAMNTLKHSLPASEEVVFNTQTTHTNNAWLHEAADEVIGSAGGDAEQRRNLLVVIKNRLTALRARVEASPPPVSAASTLPNEDTKLKEILARPEYVPELKRESALKHWWQRFWNWVDRTLNRLFRTGGGSVSKNSVSTATTIVRVLLMTAVAAALIFGLVRLMRRSRRRRDDGEEIDAREVLGELIAEDATAGDLLVEASALAQRGDYRAAIRRTYIALLVEMEGRGKLRLHRSKTNRDYLDAVKTQEVVESERPLYPAFAKMTGTFEQVWYGQESAGEPQFNDYLTKYRETTKR